MDLDDTLAADATAEAEGLTWKLGLVLAHHREPGHVGARLVPEEGEEYVLGRISEAFGPGVLDEGHVSRRHLRVRLVRGQLEIRDLESRNGTWVNGERAHACLLRIGDVVRLGPVLLLVQAFSGPPMPAPHPRLVGVSGELRRALEAVDRVAPLDATVLVLGETGTGKELVARELHLQSGRGGELVTVNCAAVADSVLHSELFGHTRGAFTGAERTRQGLVNQARGGTLFLDEVGDASADMQATLLRLLENREVRAVGSDRVTEVDLRFVAATNRNLAEAVRRGRFREDLYARLSRYVISLPPLSQRREDILPLARSFARRYAGRDVVFSTSLAIALLRHDWPGNVRALDNVVHRLVVDHGDEDALPFPQWLRDELERQPAAVPPEEPTRHTAGPPDRARLVELLREHDGNVTSLARALGVGRNTLYRWLKALDLDLDSLREGPP